MREDSRVISAITFLGITVLIDVAEFIDAFWRSAPDPSWETRWKALDPAESTWLAEMSRSRAWLATLTDPEEIELARGFYRRERRHRVYLDLTALPFIAAAGALVLTGALPLEVLGVVGGGFICIRGVVLYLRERRIKKSYQEAKADYLAVTAPAATA